MRSFRAERITESKGDFKGATRKTSQLHNETIVSRGWKVWTKVNRNGVTVHRVKEVPARDRRDVAKTLKHCQQVSVMMFTLQKQQPLELDNTNGRNPQS